MNPSGNNTIDRAIEGLLLDPSLTDVCLNGAEGLWFDRGHGLERLDGFSEPEESVRAWAVELISRAGKSWDAKYPFVDATLPLGSAEMRMHVAFPPIARQGIAISLRRLPRRGVGDGPQRRWAGAGFNRLLEAVRQGDSILISGATGSGKTTLAGDLLEAAPAAERIVILEDTPELNPRHPHAVAMTSRPPNADGFGEVTLRTLLRQALRMRPDRIVLGECRGPEVLDLLQALNTGHRGALATLHANSPRDALRRIELLCVLASSNGGAGLPLGAIRELLSVGVQWIAQVKRETTAQGAHRAISELWHIEGREGDAVLMRPMALT
jgi:pilus assembly protein CpaF